MRETYILFLVAFATCVTGELSEDDIPTPEKRLISTFQIVRFPNDACIGSNTRNGTCYTSAECSDKGGTSSGSCADGFGVCCTFVVTTCGQSSSENITYWDHTPTSSTSNDAFTCNLEIFPMNDNICQLRIDFDTFVITGPSTNTISGHWLVYGFAPFQGNAGENDANMKTNCFIDRFSVNGNSNSNNPPSICGTNSGYHMYVDAGETSNTLSFKFGANTGPAPALTNIDTRGLATIATRNFDIKVQQYECGYVNLAPPGCTQYFFGTATGKITTYNFAGGNALANQNQRVCIRRERLVCYACFGSVSTDTAFKISGNDNAANTYTFMGEPCGYMSEEKTSLVAKAGIGADNKVAGAYDCAIIPGAFVVAAQVTGAWASISTTTANIKTFASANYQIPSGPQIGGNGSMGTGVASAGNLNVLIIAGAAQDATICTRHVPFMMIFKSDDHEGLGAGADFLKQQEGINMPWWTIEGC